MFKRFDRSSAIFKSLVALMCLTAMLSATLYAKEGTLAQTAIDFTQVAKKGTPAVVSVKIKAQAEKNDNSRRFSDDDLNEIFRDDFFKRFFGIPRNNDQQESTPVIGQASGFIVSPNGHILTNSHVVRDAGEITVRLNDGREFAGKLIGQDPNTDIAVLKIDANDLPYLTLGNSDDLQAGQWAIAIGNPLQLQASLTVGVISATGRNNLDLARIEDFIQTDAAINRGNSGGPLMDLDGEVIGMNTAIFTNMANGGYMGIGFAIPSNLLKHVMNELIANGSITRGFLGVILQPMDANLAKAFNLDKAKGALIAEITEDAPAEKAGLKQGDIVLMYNQQPVSNVAALRNAVALMKPGSTITLTILRDGEMKEIPINIGAFPSGTAMNKTVEETAKENKYGFTVQALTPEIAQTFGYRNEKGVIISAVKAGSPASWAGLKKGTLIIAVNQKKVSTVAEFDAGLEAIEKNKPLLLLIKQGDAVRFVSLQVN
jgi:serine protease Do